MAFTADIDELIQENYNGLMGKHDSWERVNLSEVALIVNGFPFKSKEFNVEGVGHPLVRIRDVLRGKSQTYFSGAVPDGYWIEKDDIIVGMDGDFNINWWCSERSLLNQRVCRVELISHFYNKRFLFHVLPGYLDAINQKTSSVTVKHLSSKTMLSIPIPLPPLHEQARIANKLDELLALVETIKTRVDAIPAILKRFRQSVLTAAVSGRLTEEWRSSDEYFDNQGLTVPSEWRVLKAKDACSKVQSGSTPRNNPFDQGGTVPFLKVYNIVDQKIDFDYKPQFILHEVHAKNLKRSVAYPGDVLMNIVGPPLGKVAILTDQYPEWNLNQAITLFRANDEILTSKYLYYVLCEGQLVRTVMPETRGQVGQVNISLSQCRESVLPIPSAEEQKQILQRVERFFAFADQVEQRTKDAQARIDKLTQSILAKGFRGELVPQDSSDEPASELLTRIHREREAAEKLKKAATKVAKQIRRKKENKILESASNVKINKKNVKAWLESLNEEMFDYQDLERDFIGPKSEIEKIIFSLMGGAEPLITQVFDSGAGKIRFKKI